MAAPVTLNLNHNGKRAYLAADGSPVICSEVFSQRTKKHSRIRLTAHDHEVGNGEPVNVRKTEGGWVWPDGGYTYPIMVYKQGSDILDGFFPDAQVGDVKTIWLKCQEL